MSDDDRRLERYVAGELSPTERVAFEDEILANPDLVDRMYEDANLLAALDIAGTARRERSLRRASSVAWWRRPMSHWLPPLAAAAAALAVVMTLTPPRSPSEHGPVYRGGTPSPDAFGPRGTVDARPDRFAWSPIEGAGQYRIEVYDHMSTRVFLTVTASTYVDVDPATAPAVGYWVLTPLDDIGVTVGDAVVTHYRTAE